MKRQKHRDKKQKHRDINMTKRIILYSALTFSILLAFSLLLHSLKLEKHLCSLKNMNSLDILLGQIANTMIVLSLTSVLSENFGTVYWEDIKEEKLVKPLFTCFIAITVYLLFCVVFSIFSYVFSFYIGLYVSFAYSVGLLICLMGKMISIHYGRENLKRKLYLEYMIHQVCYNADSGLYIHDDDLDDAKKLLAELKRERKVFRLRRERTIPELEILISKKEEQKEIEEAMDDLEDIWYENLPESAEAKKRLDCLAKKLEKNEDELKKILCGLAESLKADFKSLRSEDYDSWSGNREDRLERYTRNAIAANDGETIRENIDFLFDVERFDKLLDWTKMLYDWDAAEACYVLKKINNAKKYQDEKYTGKLANKKKYVLARLLRDDYTERDLMTMLLERTIKNPDFSAEELRSLLKQRKAAKSENEKDEVAKSEDKINDIDHSIEKLLREKFAEDFRRYDLPVDEAYTAYIKGEYRLAENYLNIMYDVYDKDFNDGLISAEFKLPSLGDKDVLDISYFTKEERKNVDKILRLDKSKGFLTDQVKENLRKMVHAFIPFKNA